MPYRRSRRRRMSSGRSRPRIQHSPNEVDGTILTKQLSLRVIAKGDVLAGTSLGTTRTSTNRDKDIGAGSDVNSVTIQCAIRGITNEGYLEYSIVKIPRSFTVPATGVDPIPSNTDVANSMLESELRKNMPGWVIHNGVMPFSAETPTTRKFTVNLRKFRMSKFRDGDFLLLMLFNRSGATITIDHKANYYEYK